MFNLQKKRPLVSKLLLNRGLTVFIDLRIIKTLKLQWNPSIAATMGNNILAAIWGWPLLRGCFVHKINCSFGTWVPGRYTEVAFIQG